MGSLLIKIAIVFFWVCAVAYPDETQNESQTAPGFVAVVSGDLQVQGKRLAPSDEIQEGMTLQSAKYSSAKLILADQTILDMAPQTQIALQKLREDPEKKSFTIDLSLDYGSLRLLRLSKAKGPEKSVTVKTRASVVSAESGEWFIRVQEQRSFISEQVTVSSGKVEVTPYSNSEALPVVEVKPRQTWTLLARTLKDGIQVDQKASGVSHSTPIQVQFEKSNLTILDSTFLQNILVGEFAEDRPLTHQSGFTTLHAVNQVALKTPLQLGFGTSKVANPIVESGIRNGAFASTNTTIPLDLASSGESLHPLNQTVTVRLAE